MPRHLGPTTRLSMRYRRSMRSSIVPSAKHAEGEAAVHRDLVKAGKWPVEVGAAFSWLATLRCTGDYGGEAHVKPDEAREAVRKAEQVLQAVRELSPEPLSEVVR